MVPNGNRHRTSLAWPPRSSTTCFCSCASDDYAVARKIRRLLHQKAIYAYLAPANITSTADFTEELAAAIQASLVVVFLASTQSYQRDWVKRELVFAQANQKGIIPFCLDAAVPPSHDSTYFTLSLDHWIGTGGDWKCHFGVLRRAIAKKIGVTAPWPTWSEWVQKTWSRFSASSFARRDSSPSLVAVAVILGLVTGAALWNAERIKVAMRGFVNDIRKTSPLIPPPRAQGCVVQQTRPPSCEFLWFDSEGQGLGSGFTATRNRPEPPEKYVESLLNLVYKTNDADTETLLKTAWTKMDGSDPARVIGVLWPPAPIGNEKLLTAELLMDLGGAFARGTTQKTRMRVRRPR